MSRGLQPFSLLLAVGLGIWALVATRPGGATTFLQQPFPESVEQAPIIARGQVGASRTDWGRTGGEAQQRIYTYYEFKVTEVFKGELTVDSISMREMGGVKGGVGMQVAGASRFEPGEDVVVFLNERNSDGTYDVRGMMMGKFNLKRDADGVESLVGPGITENRGIVTDDAADRAHSGSGSASPWTLDRLRQLIDDQKSGRAKTEKPWIPAPSPGAKVVALPSPGVPVTQPTAAPRLQPQSEEETPATSGFWSQLGIEWILVVLAGLACFLWLLGRSRS